MENNLNENNNSNLEKVENKSLEEIYTPEELAEHFKVEVSFIMNLIVEGALRIIPMFDLPKDNDERNGCGIIRIPRSSVEEYIYESTHPTGMDIDE